LIIAWSLEGKTRPIELNADASWDRTQNAKSFTGVLIYRNGDLIHWRSRKQSMVALSSTERELEAILEGDSVDFQTTTRNWTVGEDDERIKM